VGPGVIKTSVPPAFWVTIELPRAEALVHMGSVFAVPRDDVVTVPPLPVIVMLLEVVAMVTPFEPEILIVPVTEPRDKTPLFDKVLPVKVRPLKDVVCTTPDPFVERRVLVIFVKIVEVLLKVVVELTVIPPLKV